MIALGERCGVAFYNYDVVSNVNTWTLTLGWGGRVPVKFDGTLRALYRHEMRLRWRPLSSCFHWWCEYLDVERHRGVVVQYRIHSFEGWPLSVSLFSASKNAYDEHETAVGETRSFWRCDHGLTGFGEGLKRKGCWRCAVWRPIKAFRAMSGW